MRTDDFFQALESYWIPLPPGIQDSFLSQTKELMELEDRLRQDESLAEYDRQIYPELRTLLNIESTGVSPNPRKVLHLCTQQLQIMENVFIAVKLAQYHSHPLNRGWMNLFRRWTAAPSMRLLWPSLKSMYSRGFVAFAEYQLNLSGMRIVPEKAPGTLSPRLPDLFALRDPKAKTAALDLSPYERLFRELGQEWPMSEQERSKEKPKDLSEENYAPYFEPFVSETTVIWTISHPESEGKEIWGIALLAPHPEDSRLQRLMIWIRPAYRGVGFGTKLLDAVLPRGKEREEQHLNLIVVLPPLRRDKPGYGDEMAGWLRFYGRKGFVRTTSEDAERILKWDTTTPRRKFDPAAFCLVMPELFRKAAREDDSSPTST